MLVLLYGFDPRLASRAYADFEPAVPVTAAGLIAAAAGLLLGWGCNARPGSCGASAPEAGLPSTPARPEAAGSAI